MNENSNDTYKSLQELILILEKIRDEGEGFINIPKSIYFLCLELEDLKKKMKDNGFTT